MYPEVRASGLEKKVNFKVFVKGTIVNEMVDGLDDTHPVC